MRITFDVNPYDEIELTPEEVEAALLEARKRKYFHVKHLDYWKEQEKLAEEKHLEENRIKNERAKQLRFSRESPKEIPAVDCQ